MGESGMRNYGENLLVMFIIRTAIATTTVKWVTGTGLSVLAPPVKPLLGTGLFGALFSRTMRPVLQRAGKAMSEFRRHKREYCEKIKEILDPALEQMRANKRDLAVLYGDDETLLSDFGYGPRDKVKPKQCLYRHDSVGLKQCKKDFAWFLQGKG